MGIEEKDKAQQDQPQDTGGNQQPQTYMDIINSVWGPSLKSKEDAVNDAQTALNNASGAVDPAKAALDNAITKEMTLREALSNESKPVRKENDEAMARRAALIKSGGDLLSALTVGINAYGKNGAGAVPTLAENSPLKDLDKLNQLQEEYAKRKEAWETLDRKVRMQKQTAETTKAKEAYEAALAKMANAHTRYDDAVKAYETLYGDYLTNIGDFSKEEYRAEKDLELENQKHQNRKEITDKKEAGANARAEKAAEAQKEAQKGKTKAAKKKENMGYLRRYADDRGWGPGDIETASALLDEGYTLREVIELISADREENKGPK